MIVMSNTFDEQAVAALEKRFPTSKVIDEQFNHFYTVEISGRDEELTGATYGYAGIVNGDLECDLYYSDVQAIRGDQPFNSIKIEEVIYDTVT